MGQAPLLHPAEMEQNLNIVGEVRRKSDPSGAARRPVRARASTSACVCTAEMETGDPHHKDRRLSVGGRNRGEETPS